MKDYTERIEAEAALIQETIKFCKQIAGTVERHENLFEEEDAEPEELNEAELRAQGMYLNNNMRFYLEDDRLARMTKRELMYKMYDNFTK